MQASSSDEDANNYWSEHLNQIPNMLKVNKPAEAKEQQRKQGIAPNAHSQMSAVKKWEAASSKLSSSLRKPTGTLETQSAAFRKAEEEKKDDDASEDRDNHTDTTAAMTTVVSEAHPVSPRRPAGSYSNQDEMPPQSKLPQSQVRVAPLKRENLEKLETEIAANAESEKALSPQELRKKELEALRNGSANASPPSSGFKSQSAILHAKKLQQERVNECNDQRGSFASLRQRLKSPLDNDQSKTQLSVNPSSSPQSAFQRSGSPPSTSSKSEVGVSSFIRQKRNGHSRNREFISFEGMIVSGSKLHYKV